WTSDLGDLFVPPDGPILVDLRRPALDCEGVALAAGAVCSVSPWILAWSHFNRRSRPGICLCPVIRGLVEADENNCGDGGCDGRTHPCIEAFPGSTARFFVLFGCPLGRGSCSCRGRAADSELAAGTRH